MTLSSTSPLHHLYYLFVSSPVTSSHYKPFFSPFIFTSHLVCHSVYITLSVCTAAVLPFNWLFKACQVIWYLILPIVFYNTNVQMSANVINKTGGQSVQTFIYSHECTDNQQTFTFDEVINHCVTSCNVKQMREQCGRDAIL